ncbi:hypothetical protein [Stieleria varia]|uniref:Uncharacterized protein n=1 Tax=Stieleria varia TaxID=2528005 RepID=A0A5C6B3B9_9BACT|nr:hypothetical protein [Stieleria varia]TWU06022.1 hypothetical protein Pla52n_17390 [Stieleria varia]
MNRSVIVGVIAGLLFMVFIVVSGLSQLGNNANMPILLVGAGGMGIAVGLVAGFIDHSRRWERKEKKRQAHRNRDIRSPKMEWSSKDKD